VHFFGDGWGCRRRHYAKSETGVLS
jgi:hypothetical protein